MQKKWKIQDDKKIDEIKIQNFSKKYNVTNLVAEILIKKDIVEDNEVRKFLAPTRKDFYDPFLINDMEKAVNRILVAIEEKQKICIYGDYDVDGITSTSLLKNFFFDRGIEVDTYIPDRMHEGYGVNKGAIEKIVNNKIDLLITVDCGITSTEEVDYANTLNLDVIITDHHEPKENLPKALAVIDNKRKDNTYPFRELAGVGVAFKLIQAISIKLELREEEVLKYLDIVAIGTVADIVPLLDENRVITKLGLMLINQTKNIGIQSLIKTLSYKKIGSTEIGFGIGPKINACGRIADPKEALKLLTTKEEKQAEEIANILNKTNEKRKEIESKIFDEAVEQIEKEGIDGKNVLVVAGENWNHGVIGIVASKITERYFKPTIILGIEDDIAKGSGRSIKGFNLHSALMNCQEKIEKFGGHAMAIGIQVKKEEIDEFRSIINKEASLRKIEEIEPIIEVDQKIEISKLDKQIVESLDILEPYGEANKEITFVFRNLQIHQIRQLSEGKHIKMTLKEDKMLVDAIGFGMGDIANNYKIGDKIDVIGNIEINKFGNYENIQIGLRDIRKA